MVRDDQYIITILFIPTLLIYLQYVSCQRCNVIATPWFLITHKLSWSNRNTYFCNE